jgi:adenine-specific DNA methylase
MCLYLKESLKIPKKYSESVYRRRRRRDNTIGKRKCTKGQTTIYKTNIKLKIE